MAKQSRMIFQQDWMAFHPYIKASQSDNYYLDLCNTVYYILNEAEKKFKYFEFFEDEKKRLAIMFTCYFEDVISQTGIWQCFTSKHMELYGKYLPFYEINDYYPNEINLEDLLFLSWYFFSMQIADDYLNPEDADFLLIANLVYAIFEDQYETAPENDALKEFLTIPENENDYFQMRTKMGWLFIESYLFHFHDIELKEKIREEWEDKDYGKYDERYFMAIANDFRDSKIIMGRSNLLAMRGNEWFSAFIGKEHRLYQDVFDLGERKSGLFLYKGENKNDVILQHLASDIIINLTKKSFTSRPDFVIDNTCLAISIVKWQGEWWFSGAYTTFPVDEKIVAKEKQSIISLSLFQEETEAHQKANEEQFKVFLKYNNNIPIAFFKNVDKLDEFTTNFFKFYNKSLGKDKHLTEKANTDLEQNNHAYRNAVDKEYRNTECLLFYDKFSGFEMILGFNSFIPDKNNEFFEEYDEERLLDLFTEKSCSANFVKFLMETYPAIKKNDYTSDELRFLYSDADFLLRFFKKDNYFLKTRITLA